VFTLESAPMPERYDAIVVGGGHNGLVNAAYLARAGRKVLVLERRHVLGGAAVTEEVFPGFRFSVCSYVVSLLRPEIIRELDLPRHGLEILPLDGTFTPMEGNYLWRMNDHSRSRREIYRHSAVDAEAYDEYGKAMVDMARFVKPILSMVPPDPWRADLPGYNRMYGLLRRFQKLPRRDQHNLIQLMTTSAVDLLDRWFETDVLKATMSASGIIGTFLGVRSPGTAYVLLHHYMGEIDGAFRSWGFARGGTGAISEAIASAAREAGVTIRTEAPIERIKVANGRATGVVLAGSGQEIDAGLVVSSLDPHLTFLKLMDAQSLPDDFLAGVRQYKLRGSSGKVNMALSGLPDFTCLPGNGAHLRGAVSISPGVEYMERAYDDAKYGDFSKRPYIDMVIPTLTDPSVAPPGQHILSCFVQYAPYKLREGTWDEKREAFGDTVVDTISQYAPNLKSLILHRQVLTPLDLEREWGLTEGNIFHGELSLEQLFFLRPVAGWARYRTPVKGLYMCGSATHPGGGIMGAPGRIAALEILKDGRA
jgi:phytoene dehydrogenase-like protein